MKCLLALCMLALSFAAIAGDYDVTVTREGPNVYRVAGKDAYIRTRYCYEYVYSEDSLLRMEGRSGTLLFLEDKEQCDVEGVYTPANVSPGKYDVAVSQEGDDWYEVADGSVVIKTSMCLNLALGEQALLKVDAGGSGTLYFLDSSDHCDVEAVLSRASL